MQHQLARVQLMKASVQECSDATDDKYCNYNNTVKFNLSKIQLHNQHFYISEHTSNAEVNTEIGKSIDTLL